MAGKGFRLRDFFRRSDRVPVDLATVERGLTPDGLRVSVNSTTTTLRILHKGMSVQGWGSLGPVEVPLAPQPNEPLPQRPTDVHEWR